MLATDQFQRASQSDWDDVASQPDHLDLGTASRVYGLANSVRASSGVVQPIPVFAFHDCRLAYPSIVTEALLRLFEEYNQNFSSLVEANREWETDYQYLRCADGEYRNLFAQIDMAALPLPLIERLSMPGIRLEAVCEALRNNIFEIENSIAGYDYTTRTFETQVRTVPIKTKWHAALDRLRKRYGKPIALLASTEEKFESLCVFEFGTDAPPSDDHVKRISGFDKLIGPAEFAAHIDDRKGSCDYLLFVRASEPLEKLRRPATQIEYPLLADPRLRQAIKAHAITINVDTPNAPYDTLVNDTKAYMRPMDMGFEIGAVDDLLSVELARHLAAGAPFADFHGPKFSPRVVTYLRKKGVSPAQINGGDIEFRFKPLKGTYGCYGHVRGSLSSRSTRRKLKIEINARGPYVVQIEIPPHVIEDQRTGDRYHGMHRNFVGFDDDTPSFFRRHVRSDAEQVHRSRQRASPRRG